MKAALLALLLLLCLEYGIYAAPSLTMGPTAPRKVNMVQKVKIVLEGRGVRAVDITRELEKPEREVARCRF